MLYYGSSTQAEWAIAVGIYLLAAATAYLGYWAMRRTKETRKATQVATVDSLLREMRSNEFQESYIFVLLNKDDLHNPNSENYKLRLRTLAPAAGFGLQPIDVLESYFDRVQAYIDHKLLDESIILPQVAFECRMAWEAVGPMIKRNRDRLSTAGKDFERLAATAERYALIPSADLVGG